MKFSLNWLNRYTPLPMGDKEKLNEIIDRIALQIVDVDERWIEEKDAIIDVDNKIITNRPYDFGHRGLAKEISIMLDQQYSGDNYPKIPPSTSHLPLEIEVKDPDLAPRFAGIVIKGVKVGPSTDFLKYAVESIGVRSINNIVDITNMIMLDTAQPVHAYDYKKIAQNKIVVRRAQAGEKVTTLDGVERILNENILLVTDPEKPIGIAGVMGALNSEIDETTTDIVLEVASFNPKNIRQTAKYLKHRTDAVTRFEKGIDPNNIANVMATLIETIIHVCGGEVSSDLIDVNNLNLSIVRTEPLLLDFNPQTVDKLLGFNLNIDFIKRILTGFNIEIAEKADSLWTLTIPSSRPDIKETADIIEDIGRMYGYQNIPDVIPVNQLVIPPVNNKITVRKTIRSILAASGLDEAITYSMISQKDVDTFNLKKPVRVVNPLSEDYLYMRSSLLPSLTKVVSHNAKFFDHFGVFEIARRFEKRDVEIQPYEKDKGQSLQPLETEVLSGMFYSKLEKEKSVLILRNAIENLLNKLGFKKYKIDPSGNILLKDKVIGSFNVLTPIQLKEHELSYPVACVELNLQDLYDNFSETKTYVPYSKFQSSKLNYTVVLPESVPASEVTLKISELNDLKITNIDFVGEVYREPQRANFKSISIEIILQKNDGNLTDDEIYKTGVSIENKIKSITSAEIKGGGIQRKKQTIQLDGIVKENDEKKPVIAVEILSIERHPDADRLVVTQVTDGKNNYQIVTAASNMNVGDIVPAALPGTALPGMKNEDGSPIVMKEAKLRGVNSYGMILAGDELGTSTDHEGIVILDKSKYKAGDIVEL